jgi:hypothetical protein
MIKKYNIMDCFLYVKNKPDLASDFVTGYLFRGGVDELFSRVVALSNDTHKVLKKSLFLMRFEKSSPISSQKFGHLADSKTAI